MPLKFTASIPNVGKPKTESCLQCEKSHMSGLVALSADARVEFRRGEVILSQTGQANRYFCPVPPVMREQADLMLCARRVANPVKNGGHGDFHTKATDVP